MKKMRRILAMLLCVVMVLGLVPATAFAAETTVIDAAIFCSDVHGSTSDLKNVMAGVKTSGVTYSSIGFVGDTCLTVANTESTVNSGLGYTPTVMFSYAASHDDEDGADISTNWNYSGEVENVSKNYLVYTIRETDMENDTTAEDDFTTWYNGLTDAQKALPIFIMSHRPLHHRRKDNANATDWYNAISAAAKSSDIVVFWAHNHTSESDVDTAAYYVAKNGTESFTLGTTSSSGGDTVVPNFTYMNAGYINANNQNPARLGIATTVQITADSLIFQDYNSSGAYTGTYAHNVTVERAFAAEEVTLSSIAISGTTSYYVGDKLDLTVTATYSDGTEADVTADATLSGYDMNTAGSYTVTASYEDKTATTSITVNELYINSIAVTTKPTKTTYTTGEELNLDGMVVTATYNNGSTAVITNWYQYGAVDMTTAGEKTVTIAYSNNGSTIFKATFTITVEQGVADGVVLESIEITQDPTKTEYLLSEELKLDGMVVVAHFSDGSAVELQYAPMSTSTVYGGYELDNFSMYVEKAHAMKVTYTYGGVTCTDSTTINVWNEVFADEDTGVKVHVTGDYGVTDISVADSENTYVADAVADVIVGNNYVAYDIELVFDTGYSEVTATKTVTLPIPTGVNNPVVYFVSDDGATVTNMNAVKDGNGNVTFQTSHFSTYVIGENIEIEVPENDTATGSDTVTTTTKKTVYVLTSSISSGNDYLIANSASAGSANLVANDGGDLSNTTATVVYGDCDGDGDSEYYIELTDDTNELWTVSNSYQFENQGEYLRCSNGSLSVSSQSTTWSYSSNHLSYTSSSGGGKPGQSSSTTYYLRYNNGWTVTSSSSSASSIYFYVPTEVEVETETTVSGTYSIAGEDIVTVVEEGSQANLTSTLTFTPTSGSATTTDVSATATYEIVSVDINGNTVNGDPNDIIDTIENGVVTFTGNYGEALVKVSYTTDYGTVTDYITITASEPYFTLDLCEPVTDDEGNTTYESITAPIALKGIEKGDIYSVWAVIKEHTSQDPNGTDLGDVEDSRIYWAVSNENIATVDSATGVITFTGKDYGTFTVTAYYLDENGDILCSDTITISATDSLYVVPGDGTNDFPEYPNEGAVRFDKTATAVGNYSETGLAKVELSMTGVPYTTGAAIDALLVLDMSTSMSTEVEDGVTRYDVTASATKAFIKTIVQNDDGTYNNNTVAVHFFNGTTAYTNVITNGFITISSDEELEEVYDAIDEVTTAAENDEAYTSSGTDYSTSMKAAYDAIIARDAVSDNTQALVFMSDGGPTYYTYVNGTSSGTVSNSADTIVGWFATDDNDTTDETDDTATPNASFKDEYYSTQLKNADPAYPVYTVGLGLAENSTGPQAFTALTSGAHEAVTSYILSQMATSDSYFYNIADEDAVANMGNIFSGIAASIKEAATDVKVEDKIGNNYTVNFALPENVTEDAAGMSEFYIQVVDYVLDATTHERTGVYTVLENFTFNGDGTFKSHTVDGVACGDTCNHVTFTDGVVTKIDGTYFDYTSTSDGEFLNWQAEKLTSTELCLQYFAYLDKSAGYDGTDPTPAGTYYTNEYATLTYTNFQDNEVQQEFPIPQLTWNGAQVSYVFYLVNDAGQPVNKAGKVVPFAEAVYVTDVYTKHVIWNDLEQAAGLDAEYLAEQIVPQVYALYDNDASYKIHVYEDEDAVNLNNHFVIGGDVTDEYNTTANNGSGWTNAKTTYVFNTKADGTKYNTVSTYVADDGDTNTNETGLSYLCKSAIIEGATFETSYDAGGNLVYTVTSVGNGYQTVTGETQVPYDDLPTQTGATEIGGYAYYVDENEQVYTIVRKTDGTEVREGFDFSNTTLAFAVVWKPRLETDTVVVDYGLDVVINVSENDALASGVVGVRNSAPTNVAINSGNYTSAKAQSVDVYIDANSDENSLKELKIGTASVENMTSVRFSLNKDAQMQFNKPAIFYYESDVNYYEGSNTTPTSTSMYSSVIVIPATTVYYEDEYVELKTFTKTGDTWATEGTDGWTTNSVAAGNSQTQAVDRPGDDIITAGYDANNVYGYDGAYTEMSTYSLDNAAKITVNATTRGEAYFTFYGTGFDVISMTSGNTGAITVQVFSGDEATGTAVKTKMVDTYYGYTKNDAGEWEVSANDPDALYQVPVMKIAELPYGQYTVKIVAAYNTYFDHVGDGTYDLYLDAIRIYDPVDAGTVVGRAGEDADSATLYIEDIYAEDNEGWPSYEELRNNVINASDYTVTVTTDAEGNEVYTVTDDEMDDVLEGAVFIDSEDANYNIADYVSYGPNNELYLAKGQAIAFNVSASEYIADVQIGMKLGNGTEAAYQIYNVDANGAKSNTVTGTIKTATDMYYSIKGLVDGTIVITNTSDSILSITNIKTTYKQDPATIPATTSLWSDGDTIGYSLRSLRRAAVVEEEIPEATEPEVTEPEATEPEATEPEATEPEATEPEATEPEATEPEATEPEATEPEATEPEVTEPEVTEPEATEPEVTEPEATESFVQTVVNRITKAINWLLGWLRF